MPSSKDNRGMKRSRLRLRSLQVLVLALLLALWHVLTSPTLLPPIYFAEANQAAFFFGEPIQVFARLWRWFASGEIYEHLWVTLVETLLAFLIGTVSGVVIGLWLALSPTASAILDPYIKAVNAMPRDPCTDFLRVVRSRHRLQGGFGGDSRVLHRVLQRIPGRTRSEPGGARQRAHARRKPAPAPAPRLCAERDELGVRQFAQLGGTCVRWSRRRRISRLGKGRRLPHPSG